MTTPAKQMRLGLYLQANGLHVASWRMPGTYTDPENFRPYLAQTMAAEKAKFDMVFLADSPHCNPQGTLGLMVKTEPLTLLAALAVTTSHIGLAATVSTTYTEPYNIARILSSIDHLSGGRAAWNVVTGAQPGAAANFGRASHPPHDERYKIAEEYVEVIKGLWDSWEDDAFFVDREAGRFVDKNKMHRIDHKGTYFSVAGPLNCSRSPQGYPVLIQAGASEVGRAFAAAEAEVIFTVQQDHGLAKTFATEMREAVAKTGRNPAHFKIMPGVCPIVGSSEADAKAKLTELCSYADPAVALRVLSDRMGQDLTPFPLDAPVPELPPSGMMRGHAEALTNLARTRGMTLRELRDYASTSMGHRLLIGSPEQVADGLEEWFASGAADGFNIMPPWSPGALDDFVNEVVPILQKRGLFRTEYEGKTLRENLGIPRPPHPATLKAAAQ